MKLLLLLFIATIFACGTDNSPVDGTSDNVNFIRGKVIDENGAGVAAKVNLYNNDTTLIGHILCDSTTGEYVFNVTENGLYIITISYNNKTTSYAIDFDAETGYIVEDVLYVEGSGFKESSSIPVVEKPEVVDTDSAGILTGRLTSLNVGITNNSVYLLNSIDVKIDSTITDENGNYSFNVTTNGNYTILSTYDSLINRTPITNYNAEVSYGKVNLSFATRTTTSYIYKKANEPYYEIMGIAKFEYENDWGFFVTNDPTKSGVTVLGLEVSEDTKFASQNSMWIYPDSVATSYLGTWFPDSTTIDIDGKEYMYSETFYENVNTVDSLTVVKIAIRGPKGFVTMQYNRYKDATQAYIDIKHSLMSGITILE